jgi:hypothetical protein
MQTEENQPYTPVLCDSAVLILLPLTEYLVVKMPARLFKKDFALTNLFVLSAPLLSNGYNAYYITPFFT